MTNIFTERETFKPFDYPDFFLAFEAQNQVHWMPNEISFAEDLKDFNALPEQEQEFLTRIFRFFTQADVDVAKAYIEEYMPLFPVPEVRMALSSFAAIEAVHVHAYATVIEALGFPDDEYGHFKNYSAMSDKHDYLWDNKVFNNEIDYTTPQGKDIKLKNLLFKIAKFSGFTEGLQLYSSFIMLLNQQRFGRMKNMGQIVAWSIRDESLHVETLIKLFHIIKDEFPEAWDDELKQECVAMARKMVELENNFIDLVYAKADGTDMNVQGLPKEDVIKFIEYTANRRLKALELPMVFETKVNPVLWFDEIINAVEHANFFENRGTDYAKAAIKDDTKGMSW